MRLMTTAKFCAAAACMAMLSLPSYAADQLDRIKQAGELVIGTEMQFAPFDFIKDGKQDGFNKDLFAQVGKHLGVKVRFIDLPWASVLPGLDANKFDMVGGPLLVTKARMERYAFTLPVADGTVALLKSAKNTDLTKPADIAGKVVGAARGSAQLVQLRDYTDSLSPKAEVKEYIDNNQAYADLAAGRIVAVGNSITNIAYVAQQRPTMFQVVQPPVGHKVYFAYMGHKGDDSQSLIAAINQTLTAMHADGSLAALQKKWFGLEMDVPQEPFTPNA